MTFNIMFRASRKLILLVFRCFEPKVLERMSSHYETKKPLDAELIDKIIKR